MRNREFDRMIRRRTAEEKMKLSDAAQEHFCDALDHARIRQVRQETKATPQKHRIAWILSLECIVAAVLMFLILPARDVTDQGFAPQKSQQEISATMVPVTQTAGAYAPEVSFEVAEGDGASRLLGSFSNQTEDIWLVEWSAQLQNDPAKSSGLIWLEPGVECTEELVWLCKDEKAMIDLNYCGYRVAAKMLHWLDGELLEPGMEGYVDQQSLMEDAFAAKALILAPGIWENGQAGTMRILLPDSWRAAHPEQSEIGYYLEQGILEDGSALCAGNAQIRIGTSETGI